MFNIEDKTYIEMYRKLSREGRKYIRSIKREDKILQAYLRECAISHEYVETLIEERVC